MNQSNKDRLKNPFAGFRVLSKEQDSGSRAKAPVRKVILPSAKPVAVYKDDSKSAAVLSNFLRAKSGVKTESRQKTNSGGGARAVQVSLASLRRKSTGARPVVDRSALDECTNRTRGEEGKVPQSPVEEINLVSSDDENVKDEEGTRLDEKKEGTRGCMDEVRNGGIELCRKDSRGRISTGVAIFDTVSDFEGSGDEGWDEEEEEWQEDICVVTDTTLHGLPDVVMVNGSMQPWWRRLSDFVPISELSGGVDPRDGSQVQIDFASQFKGTSMPSPGSEKTKKKKTNLSSQSKGYWISDGNGEKCFVTPAGDTLRGRAGYVAYTKSRKSSSSKTQRPRKRRKKKSKK